jgi:hypothetical protein
MFEQHHRSRPTGPTRPGGTTNRDGDREAVLPNRIHAVELGEPVPIREPDQDLVGSRRAAERAEWESVQSMFVDDPRSAVLRARDIAARRIDAVCEELTREKQALEQHLAATNPEDTEQLRLCFQRCKALMQRLGT